MTCILVAQDKDGKLWMAGDRRASDDIVCYQSATSKVFKGFGKVLIGLAGSSDITDMLEDLFKNTSELDLEFDRHKSLFAFASRTLRPTIKQAIRDYALKPNKDDACHILLASNQEIVLIHVSATGYSAERMPSGQGIGCGSNAGSAALRALELANYAPSSILERLSLSIKIVSEFNPTVDANVDIIHE